MVTEREGLEGALEAPRELLDSLAPQMSELEMVLEFPRDVVERYLYERDGYSSRMLPPDARASMADFIRKVSFSLAWELYGEEDVGVMPVEAGGLISLQSLLEYCSGIFQKLSRIVALIDRSPNQRLTRERVFVDFSLTRKAGPGSINWLMSHPRNHRFERPAPNSTIAPSMRRAFSRNLANGEEVAYLPSQIAESRVELDYNTQENRFIRRFLTTIQRDISTVAEVAESQGEEEVRTKATSLNQSINELLQYDFLKYSSPERGTQRAPTVSQRQPLYQQAYELYRTYRTIFDFDWGNPLFKLPMRRTWLLYEYWCYFKTVELLMNAGFKPVKDRVTLFFEDADSRLTLEMPKGQPSAMELLRESDDALVTLVYSGESADETFLNPAEGVYHPIAPSLFMMFEGKAYILDIKFKKYTADGSWHDDMDRLHGYRDALGSKGTTVQEAWCLYPTAGTNGQMEPMAPNSSSPPEESPSGGGIGFLAVNPGDESSLQGMNQLLQRWFPDLSIKGDEQDLAEETPGQGTPVGQLESPGALAPLTEISEEVPQPYAEEVEPPTLDTLITAVETFGDTGDRDTDEEAERRGSQGEEFSPPSSEESPEGDSPPQREDDP